MKKVLLTVLTFMFLISTMLVTAYAEQDDCMNCQSEMLAPPTDSAAICKQSPPTIEPFVYGNCSQCYIEGRG